MTVTSTSSIELEESTWEQRRPSAVEVRNCVCRIMCDWPRTRQGPERRRSRRQPYLHPIDLTPVSNADLQPVADPVVVLGKQISEYGLDFYYREPLHYRRMIASFPCGNDQWASLLMDLSWCRFGRHGLYENGGRFLRVVASPITGGAESSDSREPDAHSIHAASRLRN